MRSVIANHVVSTTGWITKSDLGRIWKEAAETCICLEKLTKPQAV